jgi:RNA polymerase sigma factor (TIGR02999 family)
MSDVTRILSAIEHGDPHAAEQLLPLVYEELRKLAAQKLANEKSGLTLQATALVHEACLRLVDVEQAQQWNSRGHFFAAAAEAMRRILVENARRKKAEKHGGGWQRQELIDAELAVDSSGDDLFAVDEALTRFAAEHPRAARLDYGSLTVENSSSITGNTAPAAFGADVDNLGVLYLDSTSTIGVLDGNPVTPI